MEVAILALLGILHTWKAASLTHLVSWSPASHSCQNDVNAAAPVFPSKGQLNRLMILNNKLLCILQNAPPDTSVVKHYTNFNTLTFPELQTYQILKFVHNCVYHQNKLPSIFSHYFTRIIWFIYITPALESIFIFNIHTVPWGKDLSNLKEVVCRILTQMNLSLSYLPTHWLNI